MTNNIEEINKTFFGKDKAKEYVVDDLETCIERLIQQQILDRILGAALAEYDNDYHYPPTKEKYGEKEYSVTKVGIKDPKHARVLTSLQKTSMDGLMLSLRTLFANNERTDHTSGGAFLRTLQDIPNIEEVVRRHWQRVLVHVECDTVHNTSGILELKTKVNALYDKLYLSPDGRHVKTYSLLEEYQRDNFHKDRWLDGEKFNVIQTTEADEVFGKKTIYHKKHKYQIRPYELHKLLNDFAEIVLLYSKLCIFPSKEGQLAPSLRNGASLKTMVKECSMVYSNPLSMAERRAIEDALKTNMPYCLRLLYLG